MLRSDEESRWSAGKASLARLLRRRQRFSRDPQPYCRLLGPRPALEFIMRFSALDSWHWFRPPKRIFSAGHRKLLKRLGFSPPKGKPFSIVNENLFVFTCHLQFFITLLNLFFIGSCFSFLPVGNDRTEPNGAGNGPRKCLEDVFVKIIISYEVGKVEFKSFEKGIFFLPNTWFHYQCPHRKGTNSVLCVRSKCSYPSTIPSLKLRRSSPAKDLQDHFSHFIF